MGQSRLRWAVILAVIAVTIPSAGAHAATFLYTYTSSVGTFTGAFEGTQQADSSILVTASLGGPALNGVPIVATPFITTLSSLLGGSSTPTVTFDGSLMDVAFCSDALCTEGITFDQFNYPVQAFLSSPAFGFAAEEFDPSQWSLMAAASVPEPTSWALLIAGFAMLGARLRRVAPPRPALV